MKNIRLSEILIQNKFEVQREFQKNKPKNLRLRLFKWKRLSFRFEKLQKCKSTLLQTYSNSTELPIRLIHRIDFNSKD